MENEERLIKANELMATIEGINWYHIDKLGYLSDGANSQYHTPIYKAEDIYNAIRNAPIIDAVEVVHGRWEVYPDERYRTCSNCKMILESVADVFRYCPNCGAKMDREE